MQDNSYPRKHARGSSPHEEIQDGFADGVRGNPTLEQVPEDSLAKQHERQKRNQRLEYISRETRPGSQPDDEGRWQDDGGESG